MSGLFAQFCLPRTDPCARWLRICRRPVAEHALSTTGLKRLHELLNDNQKRSDFLSTPSYVPTRLVDVGDKHDLRDPRLVITKDHSFSDGQTEDRRYFALSYCWGSPEQSRSQLMTEPHTLRQHLDAVPFDRLPQTLRDAVEVCRAMEVRYIWIDALCIIQGDNDDWEKESAAMAQVYSGAYLTIGAMQGDSCLSGFLKRSVPSPIVLPFRSALEPSVAGRYSIFQSQRGDSQQNIVEDHGFLIPDLASPNPRPPDLSRLAMSAPGHNPFAVDVRLARWNSRAWTFQEASMSPRLLLFGRHMAHLCTDDSRASEDGTHGSHRAEWGYSLRKAYAAPPDGDAEIYDDWRLLVRRYSARELSCPGDKLPAVSALARHFASRLRLHERPSGQQGRAAFLAGLWAPDLAHGLLWARLGGSGGSSTPGTTTREGGDLGRPPLAALPSPAPAAAAASPSYTAPSWSWASQPGAVDWAWARRGSIGPDFELLRAETTVDGLNEYGRVSAGSLSLRARVRGLPPVTAAATSPPARRARLRRTSVYLGTTFPYELLSAEGRYVAHLLFDWRHPSAAAPRDPETGEEVEDGPVDRLSMLLTSRRLYGEAGLRGRRVDGPEILLGLLVLPTGNPGEYTRAGLFFTEDRELGGRRSWDRVEAQTVRLV